MNLRFRNEYNKGKNQISRFKLTYFDIDGGRGEPARIAFHAAGVDFEDNQISFDEFMKTRGDLRFTCAPERT